MPFQSSPSTLLKPADVNHPWPFLVLLKLAGAILHSSLPCSTVLASPRTELSHKSGVLVVLSLVPAFGVATKETPLECLGLCSWGPQDCNNPRDSL